MGQEEEINALRMKHAEQLATLTVDVKRLQEEMVYVNRQMVTLSIVLRHVNLFEEMVRKHLDNKAIAEYEEKQRNRIEKKWNISNLNKNRTIAVIGVTSAIVATLFNILSTFLK